MARRHWTILVVSDRDTQIRQFRLSKELVRSTIGAALLLLATLASIGAGLLYKGSADLRVQHLAQENALLRQQVTEYEGQSQELQTALTDLSQRDQAFRLLAGLEPLHTDVLLAGVGGPGRERLEEDPLFRLHESVGRRTFSISEDMESLLRRARVLAASWEEATTTLAKRHQQLAATPSILPAHGFLTSAFSRNRMHPILHIARPHEGIDITAPSGTAIRAAADGRVKFAGANGQYGNMVEIDHGHGYATRYAHASRLLVKAGQLVKRGDRIAAVGSTGLSVGPHLHYEVLVNGRATDPRRFILPAVIPD